MLDFTGFVVDAAEGSELVMRLMKESVGRSNAREVHAKAVVLGLDGTSPPGFTSVILIDESHLTAHCYSEKGWLAIDIFTCGERTEMPLEMASFIQTELLRKCPGLVLRKSYCIPRFHHEKQTAVLRSETRSPVHVFAADSLQAT